MGHIWGKTNRFRIRW